MPHSLRHRHAEHAFQQRSGHLRADDRHEYELYLAAENIDHTRTKTKSPQINGICERFHKTLLEEFYRIAFRRKLYTAIAELQTDLDAWIKSYNEERPH
jgi:transposase InsO family protein